MRWAFNASFLKSLIFLIESTLILLVFKKIKIHMFDQAIGKEDKISHLYIGVHTTHTKGEAIKKNLKKIPTKKKHPRPTAPKKRKKALRCQTTLPLVPPSSLDHLPTPASSNPT
jgi:hypothetical protein